MVHFFKNLTHHSSAKDILLGAWSTLKHKKKFSEHFGLGAPCFRGFKHQATEAPIPHRKMKPVFPELKSLGMFKGFSDSKIETTINKETFEIYWHLRLKYSWLQASLCPFGYKYRTRKGWVSFLGVIWVYGNHADFHDFFRKHSSWRQKFRTIFFFRKPFLSELRAAKVCEMPYIT